MLQKLLAILEDRQYLQTKESSCHVQDSALPVGNISAWKVLPTGNISLVKNNQPVEFIVFCVLAYDLLQ